MELIKEMVDAIIHLDKFLYEIIKGYGTLTYLFLFFVLFAETGFVVTPFLPGDSLLFAVGAFSASGLLNLTWSIIIITIAAIGGDTVNYHIGRLIGDKIYNKNYRFIKKEYIERTHSFYEKYGGKTIIIARFVPIIRTFAPFIAGVGKMTYGKFISYNIIGGIGWVLLIVFSGYLFGNIPIVKNNFTFVIYAIIFISVLPAVIEFLRSRKNNK